MLMTANEVHDRVVSVTSLPPRTNGIANVRELSGRNSRDSGTATTVVAHKNINTPDGIIEYYHDIEQHKEGVLE